jgi:hypothetical protein
MRRIALALLALALVLPAAARAEEFRDGSVYARVDAQHVVLGNSVVERTWRRSGLVTEALVDKRGTGRTWSANRRDFALDLVGRSDLGSENLSVSDVKVTRLARGGLRVAMDLSVPGLAITRVAEAYPGVAGFRTQTLLTPTAGLVLSSATLDEAATGPAPTTIHGFRAGSDWREPDWAGPQLAVGDAHAGDWRETRTAPAGGDLAGPAQWLTTGSGGRSLFMVMERNDLPSSRAERRGDVVSLRVDYARDVLSLGPLEEQGHVENPAPAPAPGRARVLDPGETLALAPVFTGFGNGDGDEPWQFHKWLVEHRVAPWARDVVFNSDGTDENRISTGAKDDMDLATVQQTAPLARQMGVDTFVLDDGWQAISGDWEPDSPQFRDPRGTFPARFPDAEFKAVREAIAPMKLGLWMSPMHFHPKSATYQQHPEWACAPVGDATALTSVQDPDGGSNEAGIGTWGPAAIPHVKARIEHAITAWDVKFFKFDFLMWLDCAGQGDLWDMHDRFVAMLDELRAAHPDVVFQIDETNDYRLFPFESVTRGPTWFQNGGPDPDRVLHNLWTLSPWIPAFSLGHKLLAGAGWKAWPLDTVFASAMTSQVLFTTDLRKLDPPVLEAAAPWMAWQKAHRRALDGVTYPLLDDPLKKDWTALQTWNPETGEGVLSVFRQDSADPTRTVALRDVPPGRKFTLRAAPGGELVGSATSAELTDGLPIRIDTRRGAQVLLVEPVSTRRR